MQCVQVVMYRSVQPLATGKGGLGGGGGGGGGSEATKYETPSGKGVEGGLNFTTTHYTSVPK